MGADRIAGTGAEDEAQYTLIVTLDQAPGQARLVPGMLVTVVMPAPRTVVDYLLFPLRDAIARSLRVV